MLLVELIASWDAKLGNLPEGSIDSAGLRDAFDFQGDNGAAHIPTIEKCWLSWIQTTTEKMIWVRLRDSQGMPLGFSEWLNLEIDRHGITLHIPYRQKIIDIYIYIFLFFYFYILYLCVCNYVGI